MHATILFSSLAGFYHAEIVANRWGRAALLLFLLLCMVRQLRGLENIVHFGSHLNFSKNQKLNDFLVNVLAAYPVFQKVESYRSFHHRHHTQFGRANDPCKARLVRLGQILRSDGHAAGRYLQFLVYGMLSFYRDIGTNPSVIVRGLIWHALLFFPLFFLNPAYSLFHACCWLVAALLILPIVRTVAEFSEHEYDDESNEGNSTFNNISLSDLVLLHPAGDAYHLIHHLFPAIPWWNQARAHNYLMANDYAYRVLMHRSGFLQRLAKPCTT